VLRLGALLDIGVLGLLLGHGHEARLLLDGCKMGKRRESRVSSKTSFR
jgi:hypothetical protein